MSLKAEARPETFLEIGRRFSPSPRLLLGITLLFVTIVFVGVGVCQEDPLSRYEPLEKILNRRPKVVISLVHLNGFSLFVFYEAWDVNGDKSYYIYREHVRYNHKSKRFLPPDVLERKADTQEWDLEEISPELRTHVALQLNSLLHPAPPLSGEEFIILVHRPVNLPREEGRPAALKNYEQNLAEATRRYWLTLDEPVVVPPVADGGRSIEEIRGELRDRLLQKTKEFLAERRRQRQQDLPKPKRRGIRDLIGM